MPNANHRAEWANSPLYAFLMDTFPLYRNRHGNLDIDRLRRELKRSPEAVYQWLRGRKLKPSMVDSIRALAESQENRVALAGVGRKPPTVSDFNRFVYDL